MRVDPLEEAIRLGELSGANLRGAQLEGADLRGAQLEEAKLFRARLTEANLSGAQLKGAKLGQAWLERANLSRAKLEGVDLNDAELERANLYQAQLTEADLRGAWLVRVNLSGARLDGVNLRDIVLGNKHHTGPFLADVQWGTTNLTVVDWSQVAKLGDEWNAMQKIMPDGEKKMKHTHLHDYKVAVRANRQLAVALQTQGLNEEAECFAYRAQRLQRIVLRQQKKIGQYLFSGFLDLLAGYGYKPGNSMIAYLVTIFGFTFLYWLNAHYIIPHLGWREALVLSISSFHGRGFFSQDIKLGDTYAQLAAAEAVIGLGIEISFIATFTRRFFGK